MRCAFVLLLALAFCTEIPPAGAPQSSALVAASATSKTPDALKVAPGTLLPFGQIATVCGVKGKALGQEIDKSPATSRASYRLYDSAPSGTGQRSYYITGFKDGCARQFTAALALLGNPEFHEELRYRSGAKQPYSKTDTAYEAVKSKSCGAPKGQPCKGWGAKKIAKSTAFVSVYERFGDTARWSEILLHNGEVVETTLRGR
jgi:hypothetical protein